MPATLPHAPGLLPCQVPMLIPGDDWCLQSMFSPIRVFRLVAQFGDVMIARTLLDFGADPNQATEMGRTALIDAAEVGHVGVAQLLLDRGADPNHAADFGADPCKATKTGRTALIEAAEEGHVGVARLLLDRGADPNHAVSTWFDDKETAVHFAARAGQVEVVRLLLDRGANPNPGNEEQDEVGDHTALTSAAQHGRLEIVQLLLDHGADPQVGNIDKETALMMAAGSGHLEVAQLLLDRGADLQTGNTCGQTALMWAAKSGRFEVARLLLVRGADPGKTREREDDHDFRDGGTALMDAVDDGNVEVVRLLLDYGADPNQARPGDGHTALVRAIVEHDYDDDGFVCGCHPEIVRLLLERGASPSQAAANDAHVPLECACSNINIEVIRMLLQFGADPNQANQNEWTPLMTAAMCAGYPDGVRLLLHFEADPNLGRFQAAGEVGDSPLGLAVREGLEGNRVSMQLLLLFGADPNAQDMEAARDDADSAVRTHDYESHHQEILDCVDMIAELECLSPFKIAVACRLHDELHWMLCRGKIDPAGCSLAEMTTISAAAAENLWPGSPDPCPATTALMKAAMGSWSPERHRLHHRGVRTSVLTVLLVAERLRRREAGGRQLQLAVVPDCAVAPTAPPCDMDMGVGSECMQTWSVGTKVVAHGLVKTAELNGRTGLIVRWMASKMRYKVEFHGRPKSIKPGNLKLEAPVASGLPHELWLVVCSFFVRSGWCVPGSSW